MEQLGEQTKILYLKIDGMKKLSAVHMRFKGDGLIPIYGDNEDGKTTLAIDSLQWIIGGNKYINQDTITHGKDKMEGETQLGDWIIKRKATRKSQFLEVRNAKSNQVKTGQVQAFLDTFINEFTFGAHNFLQMNPYEKQKFMLDFCHNDLNTLSHDKLGMSFGEIDLKLSELEQARLDCGRDIKKFGDIEMPEKVEPVSIVKLTEERKQIEERNRIKLDAWEEKKNEELKEIEAFNKEQRNRAYKIEVEEDRYSDLLKDAQYQLYEIERLKEELRIAEEKLKKIHDNVEDCEKSLNHLKQNPPLPEKPLTTSIPKPELESTEEIDRKISEAGAINEKAEVYKIALNKKAEKEAKEKEYSNYDSKIKDLRKSKLDILSMLDTKVEGLEIREDGLYYNGVFSENWSDSQGVKICAELCLAKKPKLQAIFIDRFESFGVRRQKEISEWCKSKGIQAIVTIVSSTKPEVEWDYFTIEEGKVEFHNKEEQ